MEVHEKVELNWNNMMKGIRAQVEFLASKPTAMFRAWQHALGELKLPRRLYLIGCGDSYYCGMASEYLFKQVGMDVRAMESLEFSRYEVDFTTPEDWVVATSNSGNVSRTVEAVIRARKRGLRTWGVSYNHQGRLASAAHETIFYSYDNVGFGPGTISYTASLVAQLALAAVLSSRNDTQQTQSNTIIKRIQEASREVEQVIAQVFDKASALAHEATGMSRIVIIGGGPNYATALFGMAKQIESARHNTVAQELEEWAHEQYFCTEKGTLTIVLAPPGRAVDRAREQLQAVKDMGGRAVALCSREDSKTASLADVVLPMPPTRDVDEWMTPLLYQIPLQIFSYAYARQIGSVMLGFDNPQRMQVNFRQIFGSKLQE